MTTSRLIICIALATALSACGSSNKSPATDSITLLGGTGPLPGDPTLVDATTGETLDPIERIQLAAGRNEIPFSDNLYDTRRYSLPVTAGTSYSIEVINDESSSSEVTAKVRTELCPEGSAGVTQSSVPRLSSRTFDYNATRNCELIVDINGVRDGFHKLFIEARLSVSDGLIQDPASYEPNNSLNSAFPIEGGAQYISTLGAYDDSDYYSLIVTAGQTVSIAVPGDSTTGNALKLDVLNSSQSPLASFSSSDSGIDTSIDINFSGSMLFKFTQTIEGTPRNYSFTITPGG